MWTWHVPWLSLSDNTPPWPLDLPDLSDPLRTDTLDLTDIPDCNHAWPEWPPFVGMKSPSVTVNKEGVWGPASLDRYPRYWLTSLHSPHFSLFYLFNSSVNTMSFTSLAVLLPWRHCSHMLSSAVSRDSWTRNPRQIWTQQQQWEGKKVFIESSANHHNNTRGIMRMRQQQDK